MKIRYIFLVILMLLIVCFAGCGSSEVNEKIEVSEDVEFILERKIFCLKEESSSLYTNLVTDINSLNSYTEDWTFNKILNDDNFENIEWSTEKLDEEQKFVTFSGNCIKVPDKAKVSVVFYIQEQATAPFIWSMEIVGSEGTGSMNIQDFIDMGYDNAEALFMVDAAVTSMIAVLCEESESYNSPITETQENILDDSMDDEKSEETMSDYYLNEQGILVDKVEEFETQTFGANGASHRSVLRSKTVAMRG